MQAKNDLIRDPVVVVNNVCLKTPSKIILDSVSFKIYKNDRILLLGPNGSGKSTLLKIMGGQMRASGDVLIYGRHANSKPAKELRTFVPQQLDFPSNITVKELIQFVHRHFHPKESVQQIIHRYELNGEENAAKLSGGQKRRLALALALMSKPPLFVLDEPESGLDMNFRQNFLKNIFADDYQNERTIIMATHFFAKSFRFFNRVILMKQGRVVFDNTMERFIDLHRNKHLWDSMAANAYFYYCEEL